MKCKNCNYGEEILGVDPEHDGGIKCKLTEEEHIGDFDCNCEYTRTRRDKEARLLADKDSATQFLEELKNALTKPVVDVGHVINILTDTSKEPDDKIIEAVKYLEDFM